MYKSISGVYRNRRIELGEEPAQVPDDTRVIVTFLSPAPVELDTLGITPAQADEARQRLSTFAADWENPEMDVYDDYESVRNKM